MHLINCSLGSDKALCNDYNNVAVAYCSGNSQCNETGVLRITHLGTKTDILGRLEMCYNGYWGTVCIHYTNDLTAAVACRKLGYYNVVKGQTRALGYYNITLPNIPIVLDDVRCEGDESSLLNCTHKDFNDHDCRHYEDVVLECTGTDGC
jgi:hypothetical protein